MLPLAPARFSTTTGWPSASCSGSADGPRELVGGAARREVHDDPHRLAGPGLGEGARARPGQKSRQAGQSQAAGDGMQGFMRVSFGCLTYAVVCGVRAIWACARSGSAAPYRPRRRAVLHQRRVQRLAGIVGQRGLARRARSPCALAAATAPLRQMVQHVQQVLLAALVGGAVALDQAAAQGDLVAELPAALRVPCTTPASHFSIICCSTA